MEAIRSIQNVENGEIYLQLPEQFWGQEVEIIVLPSLKQSIPPTTTLKTSLRGCLKQYAKPNLMTQEQDAWQAVVDEKYERR
jgi:hypothetical protein